MPPFKSEGDRRIMRAAHTTDHSPILAVFAVAPALAALVLAGCSSTAGPPGGSTTTTASSATTTTSAGAAPTTGTSASTTASVQIGNTINYGSMGTTSTLDCADGKSLNIAGSNNTLTVTGHCADVTIGGAGNNITIDKIDSKLRVVGMNNTITYKDGDPKVDKIGSSNTINKGG